MFKKICIIGCGLIGSSLARAIKKNNLAEKIVSSNRSEAVNKKVLELQIVNESSSDTKEMVKDSDLVIIATPLSSYEDVILKIRDCLKNGVILTDVGSVKEHILNLVEKSRVDAVAMADVLHYKKLTVQQIRSFSIQKGLNVRKF